MEVYELLDDRQLFITDDVSKLYELSVDNLCAFAEELEINVWNSYEIEKANNFDFYANETMSGFGGCSSVRCKRERFDNLTLFSGLYANNVLVTLPSLYNRRDLDLLQTDDEVRHFKNEIIIKILVLIAYRPLVEKGVVSIDPALEFCPNCTKEAVSNLDEERLSLLIEYFKENAKVYFSELQGNYYRMDLSSMGNVLEHTYIRKNKNYFPKHVRKFIDKSIFEKRALTKEELGSFPLIDDLLRSLFEKGMKDNFISKSRNRKLLTSTKPVYEGSLGRLDGSLDYGDFMSVNIPLINTDNLSEVLELRDQEEEAFSNYRNSIVKLLKEYRESDNLEKSQQIYDDIVLPEFTKLDIKLRNYKEKKKTPILGTTAIMASSLVVGNLLDAPNSNLVSALHGLSLGLVTNSAWNSFQSDASELRENDYYFLWKLNKNIQT